MHCAPGTTVKRLRVMLGDALRTRNYFQTTSGGVGRCTAHPELLSNASTRCVPDKEAGDEERSMEDVTTTV